VTRPVARPIRRLIGGRWLPVVFGLAAFALYAYTAAPTVATVFDDSLEFQVVLPTLGIAHPSGYPLYTLLGWLFTHLLPMRDPAGRANLLSALAAGVTVGVFYLLALRLAKSRPAAAVATVAFAISPVWWSQATLAEVYALHGLFVALFLLFLLKWEEAVIAHRASPNHPTRADRWLVAAALTAGLGMAHHRMLALLLPAALVFIFWTDPTLLRAPRRWLMPVLCGLAPLLLYLYLPLRGQAVSSLDGTYHPTLAGTLDWIMARGYGVFLTGNPFNVHRDAGFFIGLFINQYGPLLILAALAGLATAWRWQPRHYTLLLLGTLATVTFGMIYKVEDVGVFFIPAFMCVALWAALGLAAVFDEGAAMLAARARQMALSRSLAPWLLDGLVLLMALVLLIEPVRAAVVGWQAEDRSHAWAVYDAGQDTIDSMAPGGEMVGLLGETTLARYFRDVLGQRPDVTFVAADAEAARYDALSTALAAGRSVYLTRDLPGVAQQYSLSAAGPLIAVSPKAAPSAPPTGGQEMGDGVWLLESNVAIRPTHTGPVARATLVWTATRPVTDELKVSARLLRSDDPSPLVANDQVPVHFTYPTTAWVVGERVQDVYDLPLPATAPAGNYHVLIILYRAADGAEVGRTELKVP
jgi:hypothetical protein